MGKKENKKRSDDSKSTKKKNKVEFDLVQMNGHAGKDNEGHEDDEDEKHNLDKPTTKKKISKPEQLCAAAYSGNKEDVEKLLDKGVDINYRDEYGKSPLHHATSGKQHHIVELLLTRLADVTLQDQRGDTPLHAAVRAGDEPSVKVRV